MTVDSNRPRRARTAVATILAVSAGLVVSAATPSLAAAGLVVDRYSVGGACSDTRTPAQVTTSTPWCSLSRAVAAAPSGNVVMVRGGAYPSLSVANNRSRTSHVTLKEQPGETVTLSGLSLTNSNYLAIEDMTLTSGADIATNNNFIRLARNTANATVNIRSGSSDVVLEGNTISAPGGSAINFSASTTTAPISNVTIRKNRILKAIADGIQLKNFRNVVIEDNEISGVARINPLEHSDVLQTVFGGIGLVFRGNWVHNNAAGVLLKDGNTSGVVIESNTFTDNKGDGQSYTIQLFDSAAPRIVNNTIWNNTYGVYVRKGTTAAVVVNNIMQSFGFIEGATRATQDYNVMGTGTGFGLKDRVGQPTFMSPALGDYRLAPTSIGIDAATSDFGAPVRDRLGLARYDRPATVNTGGGAIKYYDIGAVESQN